MAEFKALIEKARQVRMEVVLESLGSNSSEKERNKWHCPAHGGTSFHVWPESNRGQCFGCNLTSGRNVDPLGLLMATRRIGFVEAVEQLTGVVRTSGGQNNQVQRVTKKRQTKRITPCPEMNSRIYYHLFNIASGQDQSAGKIYLEGRGIPWEWAHSRFGLTWLQDPKIAFDILNDNYWNEEIESSGLVNSRGGFGYWFPLLLVPYFDGDYIVDIEGLIKKEDRGRNMNEDVKSLALKGIPRHLWGLNHISKGGGAVLVEGVIDALSVMRLTGEENVIAVPGVGQIEKVLQPKIGLLAHLRVLADRDEHGEGFSKQLRDQLAFKFPNVEITLNRYPEGLNDANEWLMKKTLIAA